MEFHEKLQELRKKRGLTQEELAEALYVSRTAISKWESGRGYPSIDSLKEISGYFSVSIDDLLSGEKLIFLAEKENRSNIQNICEMLFGLADVLAVMLIILPLYPKTIDGFVYSVNLWNYSETAVYNRMVYWSVFMLQILIGIGKLLQNKLKVTIRKQVLTWSSAALSIIAILYLVLAREVYAAVVAILLMLMKSFLIYVSVKRER